MKKMVVGVSIVAMLLTAIIPFGFGPVGYARADPPPNYRLTGTIYRGSAIPANAIPIAPVTIENMRTGEYTVVNTNLSGHYFFNLRNFGQGYQLGDNINIEAQDTPVTNHHGGGCHKTTEGGDYSNIDIVIQVDNERVVGRMYVDDAVAGANNHWVDSPVETPTGEEFEVMVRYWSHDTRASGKYRLDWNVDVTWYSDAELDDEIDSDNTPLQQTYNLSRGQRHDDPYLGVLLEEDGIHGRYYCQVYFTIYRYKWNENTEVWDSYDNAGATAYITIQW